MTTPATITADEIGAAIGKTGRTVRVTWRRWNRDHGFPRPLPISPGVWSRALVEAWLAGGGMVAAVEAERRRRTDTPDTVVAAQRDMLERRFGVGRAGRDDGRDAA